MTTVSAGAANPSTRRVGAAARTELEALVVRRAQLP